MHSNCISKSSFCPKHSSGRQIVGAGIKGFAAAGNPLTCNTCRRTKFRLVSEDTHDGLQIKYLRMVREYLDGAFTILSRKQERWICEAWV